MPLPYLLCANSMNYSPDQHPSGHSLAPFRTCSPQIFTLEIVIFPREVPSGLFNLRTKRWMRRRLLSVPSHGTGKAHIFLRRLGKRIMEPYIWQQKEWPHFTWDSATLLTPLGECRLLQGKLLAKLESLGLNRNLEAQADMLVEETVKTAAIENQQLDVRSVRCSVARRLGLPSAGMPFDRSIDDLVSVLLDAAQNYDLPLTRERLWGWQAALFPSGYSGMHKIKVGGWRDSGEPMRVISGPRGREKIHYEAPPSVALEKEMAEFLQWFAGSRGKIEGIVRAGLAHLWFVTIHPFDDGNGRLARTWPWRRTTASRPGTTACRARSWRTARVTTKSWRRHRRVPAM